MKNIKLETIELLEHLISCKSETPDDGGLLDFAAKYLSDFEAVRIDKEGVKNLFLSKRFGDGAHLCFAGHVDVVPSGDGWSSDPYTLTHRDGYIYGRGTQDMKSGVCAQLQALRECEEFDGTLSLLLTSDEEGEAKYGTVIVLEYLKKHSLLPDAVVVAEPTCESEFGDAIKIGRRGSINGILTLQGTQGHAAYPDKSTNPIHQISHILPHIAGVDLDNGDQFFSPSKLVVCDIRSGLEVSNVTPDTLKMMFNIRNSTKTDATDVKQFIAKWFKDTNYKLTLSQSAMPFITKADSAIVRSLDSAIDSILHKTPAHSTAGGTSDARFIAQYGIDVVEFGVINDTIHAIDERTTVNEVQNLHLIFAKMIKNYSKEMSC